MGSVPIPMVANSEAEENVTDVLAAALHDFEKVVAQRRDASSDI